MIIRNDNITEASLGSSSDLNASAFISKLISSGGVVNSTVVDAVNNLFLDLKSNELYDKVKRFYPMVGASQSACSLEAKLTGHNIIFTNPAGFVFNENGITCGGQSGNPAYINQSPYAMFGSNANIGFTMYNRTSRGALANFPLATTGSPSPTKTQLNINYDGNNYAFLGTSSLGTTAGLSTGLFMVSRTSDTLMTLSRNGVVLGTDTTPGSENSNTLVDVFDTTTDNFAFMSFNDGLTPTESLTFYTIVQNFQTALGRAV